MTKKLHSLLQDSNADDVEILLAELAIAHRDLACCDLVKNDVPPYVLLNLIPTQKEVRFIGPIHFDSIARSIRAFIPDDEHKEIDLCREAIAQAFERAKLKKWLPRLGRALGVDAEVARKVLESIAFSFEESERDAFIRLEFIHNRLLCDWTDKDRELYNVVAPLAAAIDAAFSLN